MRLLIAASPGPAIARTDRPTLQGNHAMAIDQLALRSIGMPARLFGR
jgi:hypothetical protein